VAAPGDGRERTVVGCPGGRSSDPRIIDEQDMDGLLLEVRHGEQCFRGSIAVPSRSRVQGCIVRAAGGKTGQGLVNEGGQRLLDKVFVDAKHQRSSKQAGG